MFTGEGTRDRQGGGGAQGGVPRTAGSFGGVANLGGPQDLTVPSATRPRPDRRPAASPPREIRSLVRDAPEPVLVRWSAPIRLAVLLSGAVLSWALFALLARLISD